MSSTCSMPTLSLIVSGRTPALLLLFGRHLPVRGRCRMAGQRFRVSDVDQPLEQFQRVVEPLAGLEPSRHAEGQQRTRAAAQVLLRQRVIGAVVEARVVDPSDAAVVAQKPCDLLGIFDVPLDPQRDGLDALEQQEGVERRQDGAGGPLGDGAAARDVGGGARTAR